MIPLLTRQASRALDVDAIERVGVPGLVLMENAGLSVTEVICREFPRALGDVAIVGGTGQNGGDAWVVARQLYNRGCFPRVVLVGERPRVRGDARVNLDALQRLGVTVHECTDELSSLDEALAGASLVVEGLFGTGLDRPIEGLRRDAIERINSCSAPCVSIDTPSGVDSDTGDVLGVAVVAKLTVTCAAAKRGLYQHPGARLAGKVVCVSIGVPGPSGAPTQLLEPRDVAEWVLPREPDAHKGSAGHLLVVGGSPGKTGAALLSGLGALRGGAGLVSIAARRPAREALDLKVLELMTLEIPEDDAPGAVLEHARDKAAAVLGPGLGLDPDASKLARKLARELPLPTVLDADALTALAVDPSQLRAAAAPRVLTPHPGEAARLLDCSAREVQSDRFAAATRLASACDAVVVLKGAGTLIAEPSGQVRVCARGTPALAVAGTGDVLAGAIGSLLPRLSPFDAAAAAVMLHALAGELASASDRGVFAREIADALPHALERCRTEAL